MTKGIDFEKFRTDLKILKEKHLGDVSGLSEPQLKLVLAALIQGVEKSVGLTYYRKATRLLSGGKDRMVSRQLRIRIAKYTPKMRKPIYRFVQYFETTVQEVNSY